MITFDPKNIHIADDSMFFRVKLSDILMDAGHKVSLYRDGNEIIEGLKKNPDGVDLLILDLQLPNVDGFGVLRWIKENGLAGSFPVLIVTAAYEMGSVVEEMKALGASGMMTKGFTPEQIIFRINRILFPDKFTNRMPAERIPVSAPVDFTIGAMTKTGFLMNLSETGMFLHTNFEILVGAVLNLRFALPGVDRIFDMKGVVKWTSDSAGQRSLFGGYGVMFTTNDDEQMGLIKEFVDKELKKDR